MKKTQDKNGSFFESNIKKEKGFMSKIEEKGSENALKLYDEGSKSLRNEIKRHPAQYFFLFLTSLAGSILTSLLFLYGITHNIESKLSMPAFGVPDFSNLATFVRGNDSTSSTNLFDPDSLLKLIQGNERDYILVDIRTKGEYERGHIKTAISIPVYGTKIVDKNDNLDSDALKKVFKNIINSNKTVIIYAQTEYSTLPLDVAFILNKNGGKIKVLSIGWNEWAHFKNLWVPEAEWDRINPEDYVQK